MTSLHTPPMHHRNRAWKRRLLASGATTLVALTAIIGKQAETPTQTAAQDPTNPIGATSPRYSRRSKMCSTSPHSIRTTTRACSLDARHR